MPAGLELTFITTQRCYCGLYAKHQNISFHIT